MIKTIYKQYNGGFKAINININNIQKESIELTPENVKKGLIIECIDDSDSYGYIHNGEEYMVYDFDIKNKTITIPYKGGWNMSRFIVK